MQAQQAQGLFYGYAPAQGPPAHQAHHQQQPGLPVAVGYAQGQVSPYQAAQEIHIDAGGHLAPQPGPSGLQDHDLGGPGDDDDDSGILDTPGGGKKKGGRPRDKVWELFEGDRDIAKCCFCSWKTDHPKAFRMRAHALACEVIPQERKDDLQRFQEQKEQRLQIKKETADALQAAGGAPPKKAKRSQNGDAVAVPSNIRARMPPAPPARSPITCHVLDSTSGKPAPEMRIRLDRLNTTGFVLQAQGMTDSDGRCGTLLPGGTRLEVGIFKITFFTNEWFQRRGMVSFYPFVEIPFEVKSADEHYHIPCLLSPFSYTTYRGS